MNYLGAKTLIRAFNWLDCFESLGPEEIAAVKAVQVQLCYILDQHIDYRKLEDEDNLTEVDRVWIRDEAHERFDRMINNHSLIAEQFMYPNRKEVRK